MSETIEVLGVEARQTRSGYEVRTPLGTVALYPEPGNRWRASWWPYRQRHVNVRLVSDEPSPADAAREATRRLRAIQRTCARAGAL